MSDDNVPPAPDGWPPPPLPPQRHGCLTAFMVVFGLILLLPGLCALLFAFGTANELKADPTLLSLILLGLLVGFAGAMLIWFAIKGR
jgi:drug/metabolite transporter (DMT)-like permease